jgi:FPC/CPF motif-containing protein YcgG
LGPEVADPATAGATELCTAFRAMVAHPQYPCLGARSVFRQDRATVEVYDELGNRESATTLLADLRRFASGVDLEQGLASFVALFRGPRIRGEQEFEQRLWQHLRAVHAADEQPWTPEVSSEPQDPHFAFSVAGSAYFVVGLHPRASRHARRSAVPTLVFNLHAQFEQLRASGTFPGLRDRIRARDEALQGRVNPMVSDYGQTSEARQYSGREVAAHPSCLDNLSRGLRQFGVTGDQIATTFNIFMNVWTDPFGSLHIDPPTSVPGDRLVLRAEMDLHVGLTACSAEKSNGGVCKPIDFEVTAR